MTDGQLWVLGLILLLIGLEVWLHWATVRPWLRSILYPTGPSYSGLVVARTGGSA